MKALPKILIVVVLAAAVVAVVAVKARKENSAAPAATSDTASSDCSSCASCPNAGGCPGAAARTSADAFAIPEGVTPEGTIVELGSTSCTACKAMKDVLGEIFKTYGGRLEVVMIDVKQDPTAQDLYAIRRIPTQVFLNADGDEVFRHEGFLSRDAIVAKWQELGVSK